MRMRHVISIGALLLGSSATMAGFVQSVPVTVELFDDGSGSASGDMATARVSNNVVELIGCGVRRFDNGVGGVTQFGFCQATSAAGVAGFCITESPALLEALADLNDYSFIAFSWDSDGVCRFVGSSTQSFYLPGPKPSRVTHGN